MTLDNNLTFSCSCGVANVILCPVQLIQLQEFLHSLCGDPGLHESIDNPGEGIQGTDEDVEESHTGEHLQAVGRGIVGDTIFERRVCTDSEIGRERQGSTKINSDK